MSACPGAGPGMARAAMTHAAGFAPVSAPDARVLILGTLPGPMSLQMGQYYAQPRNAFWRAMAPLTGVAADSDYAARLDGLLKQRIALWDVCAAAVRPGALDASIVRDSVQVNDFAAFFMAHMQVRLIAFNGATAARLFVRHDVAVPDGVRLVTLPSSSPAHAAMTVVEKVRVWGEALQS